MLAFCVGLMNSLSQDSLLRGPSVSTWKYVALLFLMVLPAFVFGLHLIPTFLVHSVGTFREGSRNQILLIVSSRVQTLIYERRRLRLLSGRSTI